MQFGIEYRPYNFSGVIAQDKVVKGLQNSLSKGNLGHAVALIGNSGLGKNIILYWFKNLILLLYFYIEGTVGCEPIGEIS